MSDNLITRRASYGPSSPQVGVRGAKTRRKIVDVSLELFAELGFLNTSVDAIASAANVSRATLYQYFPGKDEIFFELLDECGGALIRVARRIGELGPTERGFDNLHWWLGEWSWVFEKYQTMFVQWSVAASVDTKVSSEVIRFVGGYNQRVAARLAASDLEGIEPLTAAAIMTAIVHRLNLFIHTGRVYGADNESLVTALSLFLQQMLFPQTPISVLNSLRLPSDSAATIEVPAGPSTAGLSVPERIEGLSKRAVSTVRKLVDAGVVQFGQRGYHRASVDDIVEEAGFARGTFYKYFSEKQDLLVAICTEATAAALEHAESLRHIDLTASDDTDLRAWLASFLDFLRSYTGSIDVWTQQGTDSAVVLDLGTHTQAVMDSALASVLTTVRREYPFDPLAAAIVFRALITRIPESLGEMSPTLADPEALGQFSPPLTRDRIIDLLARCIRRGFFSNAR